jgi:glycosyltransferase involved in cell wall biosynthesis
MQAKESTLLHNAEIATIPNTIDTEFFKPYDKMYARQKFNLPNDKKLILFVAAKLSDARKGISYFVDVCKKLASGEMKKSIEVVFLGGKMDENLLLAITLKTHVLGYLKTPAEISMLYAACDIFVTSSLEDNLPNTIMEAMACGTPCIGFNVGGIPEMIDHKVNGYIAKYKSSEDLTTGIRWCLNPENRNILSEQALMKVNCYAEKNIVKQYIDLYTKTINDRKEKVNEV